MVAHGLASLRSLTSSGNCHDRDSALHRCASCGAACAGARSMDRRSGGSGNAADGFAPDRAGLLSARAAWAFGRGISTLIGHPLAFSFGGLVVGSVIYSLPFAVQPLVAGFAAVDGSLVDAARLLGAGPVRVVSGVLVPLAGRSLLAAIVLSFLHTIGEFGVVLMLGGDIPGATRTLSIVLYDQVENFDYAAAGHTAELLLGLSVIALALVYATARGRSIARIRGDRSRA
jgi:ABC-type molybdate transport system permease subunit